MPIASARAASGAAESGWWWRAQSTPVALPVTPPGIPPGGLYVAADPSGSEAVAALRVVVPADASAVTMTLSVASTTGLTPSVEACTTTSSWTAPDGAGAWADRPTSACTLAVRPTFLADGATWSFDVTSLVKGTALDVLIQPSGSGLFGVSFDAPTAQAIQVLRPVSAPQATSVTRPAPAPAPAATRGATGVPDLAAQISAVTAVSPSVAPPDVAASAGAHSQISPVGRLRPLPDRPVVAVVAAVVVAMTWLLRTRHAVSAAASHPLAKPISVRWDTDGLRPSGDV